MPHGSAVACDLRVDGARDHMAGLEYQQLGQLLQKLLEKQHRWRFTQLQRLTRLTARQRLYARWIPA